MENTELNKACVFIYGFIKSNNIHYIIVSAFKNTMFICLYTIITFPNNTNVFLLKSYRYS